jgi:dipeptidyl aminopeptidase/acylaminoacyl peptidase
MTTEQRLERDLPAILGDLANGPYPDYIDDVLATTAQRRQRPAWTFPERWLPMDMTLERVGARRTPILRIVGLVTLVALLVIAVVVAVVGMQRRVPAPFGPAANGLIAYVDAAGAIVLGDPATGLTEVLVEGPGVERPVFSPDGTFVAFLRSVPGGGQEVAVIAADGTGERVISAARRRDIGHLGWTPDGRSVVVSSFGGLSMLATAGGSETRLADADGEPINTTIADDFNADLSDLFRPLDGSQVLYVVRGDTGDELRSLDLVTGATSTLLAPTTASVPYNEITAAQWSPDGSMMALTLFDVEHGDYLVHVMNADGSGLRRLVTGDDRTGRSEANPVWSPDGRRLAILRWYYGEGSDVPDVRPITVVDVERGTQVEMSIVSPNGYLGFSWSPDGEILLAVADDDRRVVLLDASTGVIRLDPGWDTEGPATYQRQAP